jgi:diguanylate cyclase (GGDEF)-like protein
MAAAFIATGAALVTLAAVCLVILLVRRAERAGEQRAAAAVSKLTDALEEARRESRQVRTLDELVGSLELDEVVAVVLATTAALPGADASLVSLVSDGEPVVATHGLSSFEAGRQRVPTVEDGNTRSVAISYEYQEGEVEPGSEPVRTGVAVPLHGEAEPLGMLAAFSRRPDHSFDEATTSELEALASRAAPAIEAARRFREARELADIDALTGLHNRRYFHETLEREVSRARRYRRPLSLVVLDLDDFKAVNDRIGHLAGDDVLAEIGQRIRAVVRTADVACRIGGEEFAVLLPESELAHAEQLYDRLAGAVAARPVGEAGDLSISGGITHLHPDDSPTTFFERGDEALYEAKAAGKARAHVINGPAEADTGEPLVPS